MMKTTILKELLAVAAGIAGAALAIGASAGCDTPPASPVNTGVTAVAPAHASPDPPPGRPVILEDAGRGDTGAFDAGLGLAATDGGGATDADDAGAAADAAPEGGALRAAWQSVVSGADASVTALRPKFRACYTRNIKGRPQGRVMLHATVAANGTVQGATASDTQGVAGGVVACMLDVLKAAQLPAPGRATTLDVPVSFQSP
jgi:hypothetical protein